MRAGTLSDPRVVALLRKYFICAQMSELSTRHLIADPRDVELLERYQRDARGKSFEGGEREAFFTANGELLDVFLSLHCGSTSREWNGHTYTGQYCQAERAAPEAAVERWFSSARRALARTLEVVPADFGRFRDGTAPEVAAVRELVPSLPRPDDEAGFALRVTVRADVVMYEQLVGSELLRLTAVDARRLLPAQIEIGGPAYSWPRDLFCRVFRLAYPRGGGVLIELADGSVAGDVVVRIERVTADEVRGTLRGSLRLEPKTVGERSYRTSYKPWQWTAAEVVGDFCWDPRRQRFTGLRLVSRDGRSAFLHGKSKTNPYRLGIELCGPRRIVR